MIVVLADLLTADHDDWHAHLRNETDTVEIVVLPEHRQVSSQADRERELNDALSELRTKGVSVMTAINMIEQWQRVDSARAKEILFSHPDWNSEGS